MIHLLHPLAEKCNQIPQISYFSTGTTLANKILYPTFMRTIPSDSATGVAMAQVINYFGWTHVGVIVGSDSYSISCMSVILFISVINELFLVYQSFYQAATQLNFTIAIECFLEPINPHFQIQVSKLKEGTRHNSKIRSIFSYSNALQHTCKYLSSLLKSRTLRRYCWRQMSRGF